MVLFWQIFFDVRRWLSAKQAIVGRWVIHITWWFFDNWYNFSPIFTPASPPIPASTSSKINTGTSSTSCRDDFIASITRDNSPPEAILFNGFGISPILGEIKNSISSHPVLFTATILFSQFIPFSSSLTVIEISKIAPFIARSFNSFSTLFFSFFATSHLFWDSSPHFITSSFSTSPISISISFILSSLFSKLSICCLILSL